MWNIKHQSSCCSKSPAITLRVPIKSESASSIFLSGSLNLFSSALHFFMASKGFQKDFYERGAICAPQSEQDWAVRPHTSIKFFTKSGRPATFMVIKLVSLSAPQTFVSVRAWGRKEAPYGWLAHAISCLLDPALRILVCESKQCAPL